MNLNKGKDTIPKVCLMLIILGIILTGINPADRLAWAGESFMIIIAIVVLVLTYEKVRLSNLSHIFILIYLLLPLVGGYFVYSSVDLGFIDNLIDPSRNNLDRIVHFLSGFLLALPIQEILVKKAKIKNSWKYFLSIAIITAGGAFYEILEWIGVILFSNPQFASNFLGMQGDIWDAQKDMLMSIYGAILFVLVQLAIMRRTKQ